MSQTNKNIQQKGGLCGAGFDDQNYPKESIIKVQSLFRGAETRKKVFLYYFR